MPPTPVTVVRKIQALEWDGKNTKAVLDFLHAYPPFGDSDVKFEAEKTADGLVVTTQLDMLTDIFIPLGGYIVVGDGVTALGMSADEYASRYHPV